VSAATTTEARLLSLNVGMPRDVRWQGEVVHTGIWKDPVNGPRMVTRLNVEGDGQGDLNGHGGVNRAVFVYQIESYRYWKEQLERDDFVYGQFGENFTVQGMSDDEVCIGDRYRIGEAIFGVSQPRVTCYRLGIRMDEPRMPSLVVAHRRPGFYLRTVREGRVQAGDEIEKLATGAEAMTIAEIDGLLYLPRRSRTALVRALRIPTLSEGWQGSFRELLEQCDAAGGHAGAPPPLAWNGLRPLRVESITPESADVVSIHLRPRDFEAGAVPQPGQFLTVRLTPDAAAVPLMRSYSLSGPPKAGEYRISVKREPQGAGSGYLHTGLHVGDVLQAGAPRGTFVLRRSSLPAVLISAGVGVTPVLSMLHALVAERAKRPVWWLYAARDSSEHPFRDEVAELLAALPQAHRLVCYSRPAADDRLGEDFDVAEHLTGAVMNEQGVPFDADFYGCGPEGFMHDITATLAARGATPDRVHSEIFGASGAITPGVVKGAPKPPPHPPAGDPGAGEPVSFARNNLSVPWDPTFRSILEFAEACDVQVRWSCRTGVCHTCVTGLVSGAVQYDPQPLEPAAPGDVLICCARPTGELVLDL
jgi:ferredoxin-NADP reductase/MOSC domain-containing protein YiiM/ferredoxin